MKPSAALGDAMVRVDGVVETLLGAPDETLGTGSGILDLVIRILQADETGGAATGTLVVAGGVGGWRLVRRVIPIGVALYARLRKVDLARHPARAALLERIRAEPGATTRMLVAATRLKKGTALHHLRTLERGGLVRSRRVGRDRAWFDAAAQRADPAILDALHATTRRRILALAQERPGITQAQLARELGYARATIHQHVDALRAAGLVETRRVGVRAGCYARVAA